MSTRSAFLTNAQSLAAPPLVARGRCAPYARRSREQRVLQSTRQASPLPGRCSLRTAIVTRVGLHLRRGREARESASVATEGPLDLIVRNRLPFIFTSVSVLCCSLLRRRREPSTNGLGDKGGSKKSFKRNKRETAGKRASEKMEKERPGKEKKETAHKTTGRGEWRGGRKRPVYGVHSRTAEAEREAYEWCIMKARPAWGFMPGRSAERSFRFLGLPFGQFSDSRYRSHDLAPEERLLHCGH